MMKNKLNSTKNILLALVLGVTSVLALPGMAQGQESGLLMALNVSERKVRINEKVYRVALAARLKGVKGETIKMDQLPLKSMVSYSLAPGTGDLLDLKVIVIP